MPQSTTHSPSTGTDESAVCAEDECSDTFAYESAVAGGYCSAACYYRSRGRRILLEIEADHRFCATCFAAIKEIQEPPEDWADEHSSKVMAALDSGAEFVGGDGGHLVLDCTGLDSLAQPVAADAVIGLQSANEQTLVVTDEEPLERVDGKDKWERKVKAEDGSWEIETVDESPTYRRRRRGRWGCQCGNVDHSHRDETLERVEHSDVVLNLLRLLFILVDEDRVAHRPTKADLFDALREYGRDWEQAIGRAIYETV